MRGRHSEETDSARLDGAAEPHDSTGASSFWKDRYAALEARLSDIKTTLAQTRQALRLAQEREQATRSRMTRVRESLHWRERALLRPEVLADLMPARAQWRKRAGQDEIAARREAIHAAASEAYAVARDAMPPPDADCVEICGVEWWVPRDARLEGRLADRIVRERNLPFADILRTREVISNGTMLDIGANIGLTSVTRAVLGDADLVYAAEPAPDNFACLVRTVMESFLRGIVLPDRVAISDRDGTAKLRLSGSIGGHSIGSGAEGPDVPTLRLDTWVKRLGIDVEAIRFVKVDTQGHEGHVLDGAPDLLRRAGVVWELEFSPRHLRKAGRSPSALIEHMRAVFTHFIDLNPHAPGSRIRPIAELGDAMAYLDRSFTNLLAYRASAMAS